MCTDIEEMSYNQKRHWYCAVPAKSNNNLADHGATTMPLTRFMGFSQPHHYLLAPSVAEKLFEYVGLAGLQ